MSANDEEWLFSLLPSDHFSVLLESRPDAPSIAPDDEKTEPYVSEVIRLLGKPWTKIVPRYKQFRQVKSEELVPHAYDVDELYRIQQKLKPKPAGNQQQQQQQLQIEQQQKKERKQSSIAMIFVENKDNDASGAAGAGAAAAESDDDAVAKMFDFAESKKRILDGEATKSSKTSRQSIAEAPKSAAPSPLFRIVEHDFKWENEVDIKLCNRIPQHRPLFPAIAPFQFAVTPMSLSFSFAVGTQIEPYFCSLALFDLTTKQRVSENYTFELNNDDARKMLTGGTVPTWAVQHGLFTLGLHLTQNDVHLVLRVERVLQGDPEPGFDAYSSKQDDNKTREKMRESARDYCARLGSFRQPFVWASVKVFKDKMFNMGLNTRLDQFFIQKTPLSDAAMCEAISAAADQKKRVAATFLMNCCVVNTNPETRAREPVLPKDDESEVSLHDKFDLVNDKIMEVTQFAHIEDCRHCTMETAPLLQFVNDLFIYPESVNFSNLKTGFGKSRNVSIRIQLRASDASAPEILYSASDPAALKVLYSGLTEDFMSSFMTQVTYHSKTPTFQDEIKARLPVALGPQHHLLFTFFHIPCQVKGTDDEAQPKVIGFSVLPLYEANIRQLPISDHNLPVFYKLDPGYLKSTSMALQLQAAKDGLKDKDAFESGKPVFKLSLRLNSSLFPKDEKLSNFLRMLFNESAAAASAAIAPTSSASLTPAKSGPADATGSPSAAESASAAGAGDTASSNTSAATTTTSGGDAATAGDDSAVSASATSPAPAAGASSDAVPLRDASGNATRTPSQLQNRNTLAPTGSSTFRRVPVGLSIVDALHEIKTREIVRWFHLIAHKLLALLCDPSWKTKKTLFACLLHLVELVSKDMRDMTNNRNALLASFVEFYTPSSPDSLHSALVEVWIETLSPNQDEPADSTVVHASLIHSWFLLELIAKSLAVKQYASAAPMSVKAPQARKFSDSAASHTFLLSLQSLLTMLTNEIRASLKNSNKLGSIQAKAANRFLARFMVDMFSLVPRHFAVEQYNRYQLAMQGNEPEIVEFRFDTFRILADYEHFVPLNLAQNIDFDAIRIPSSSSSASSSSNPNASLAHSGGSGNSLAPTSSAYGRVSVSEMAARGGAGGGGGGGAHAAELPVLTTDLVLDSFGTRHFIVKALLGELKEALMGMQGMALKQAAFKQNSLLLQALNTLKTLMCKHDFDSRYQSRQSRQRLAGMYFPYLLILIEYPPPEILGYTERRLLFVCFAWILEALDHATLLAWWRRETEERMCVFLGLLRQCLMVFRYEGEEKAGETKNVSVAEKARTAKDFFESMYAAKGAHALTVARGRGARKGTVMVGESPSAGTVRGAGGAGGGPAGSGGDGVGGAGVFDTNQDNVSTGFTVATWRMRGSTTMNQRHNSLSLGPMGAATLKVSPGGSSGLAGSSSLADQGAGSAEVDQLALRLEGQICSEISRIVLTLLEDFIGEFGAQLLISKVSGPHRTARYRQQLLNQQLQRNMLGSRGGAGGSGGGSGGSGGAGGGGAGDSGSGGNMGSTNKHNMHARHRHQHHQKLQMHMRAVNTHIRSPTLRSSSSSGQLVLPTAVTGSSSSSLPPTVLSGNDSVILHESSFLGPVYGLVNALFSANQSNRALPRIYRFLEQFTDQFATILFSQARSALTTEFTGQLCASTLHHLMGALPETRVLAIKFTLSLLRKNWITEGNLVPSQMQLTAALSKCEDKVADGRALQESFDTLIDLIAGLRKKKSAGGSNNSLSADAETLLEIPAAADFYENTEQLFVRISKNLVDTINAKKVQDTDAEMLADLYYKISEGFSQAPVIQLNWLRTLGKSQQEKGNFAEAAQCYLYISTYIAKYRGYRIPDMPALLPFEVFPEIECQAVLGNDPNHQEIDLTEEALLESLENTIDAFKDAELFEYANEVQKLHITILERSQMFGELAQCHAEIAELFALVQKTVAEKARFLGTYYRVGFYGPRFAIEGLHNREFIYKEPKLSRLADITDRLKTLYDSKFGVDVQLIPDAKKVDPENLNKAQDYIQVTFVNPYFSEEELEVRHTQIDLETCISRFSFEIPFTPGGAARGEIREQYIRRFLLTTIRPFPSYTTRLEVVLRDEIVLTPIQNSISSLRARVKQMREVLGAEPLNIKSMQSLLTGSVLPQVNTGPSDIYDTFIHEDRSGSYPADEVEQLKDVMFDFLKQCRELLIVNKNHITQEQSDFQFELNVGYQKIVSLIARSLEGGGRRIKELEI